MFRIAYCTNVHAGKNLVETRKNLSEYAVSVKRDFCAADEMGIGLWLSAKAAEELCQDSSEAKQDEFSQFLSENGLDPFTFNGFPFGDFHQNVVKHDVYRPSWFDFSRQQYSERLVHLIQRFSSSPELSISTLPIGWGNPPLSDGQLSMSAKQLARVAETCRRIESETGRLVYFCVEPEPGCHIQYAKDVVDFFESFLFRHSNEDVTRRHIRVCHDVCHAVVMCESQAEVMATYKQAGISIGKVQISSAVVVDFDVIEPPDRTEAVQQLSTFAEDRYLHQTTIQNKKGEIQFYEDLPLALKSLTEPSEASGIWRIHFHIPVHLDKFGLLSASQHAIEDCVTQCRRYSDVVHFEVETYAWNVLPPDLRENSLSVGITKELRWFQDLARKLDLK